MNERAPECSRGHELCETCKGCHHCNGGEDCERDSPFGPQTIVLQRIIPNGVQAEYDAAIQRTGLTPQLERAVPVLISLFRLNDPSAVQKVLEDYNKLGLYA